MNQNSENQNNERIIHFERLKNRTIQKDKNPEKNSLFSDVYKQASELVGTIIRTDTPKREKMRGGNQDIDLQPVTDSNNVIAFIGRRGTGKTSAMLAFSDALVNGVYNEIDELKNVNFISLPYIDASMSGIRDEDFFEIIISKMLKYLEDFTNNHPYCDREELCRVEEDLALIYSHYTKLNHSIADDFKPSYTVLKRRMDKHNIHTEIFDLIDKFVRFISKTCRKWNEHDNTYMVICIDDIDMARKNHLDILQLIYQYFMIPGVIVLVTLNYKPLSYTIKKDFYNTIAIRDDKDFLSQSLVISGEQTLDYLRKIIPSDMRISMPSWKKMDLRDLSPIRIKLGGYDDIRRDFPKLSEEFIKQLKTQDGNNLKKLTGVSPKELLMLLLADRTHCYLDTEGHKFHFMEPESLRELYDLFYLLYNMKCVESDEYRKLEYNRKILLNYLYFRMIPDFNLDPAVEKLIKNLQSDMIDRRGREIWENYYHRFKKMKDDILNLYGKEFIEEENQKHKVEKYNFGEMFRALYFGSRLDLYDKNYVKSVLAIYAFNMPQYVEMQKKARRDHHRKLREASDFDKQIKIIESSEFIEKVKKRENYMYRFRELREIFGYSLLGEWRRDLFNGRRVSIVIDKEKFKKNMRGRKHDAVKHLIYLLLLSARSSREQFHVTEDDGKYFIDADLDPTAFVMGTVRVARIAKMEFVFKNRPYSLWDLLSEMKILSLKKKAPQYVSNAVKEIYGEHYFEADGNAASRNRELWFLLKNIDITYNVIKRTIKQFLYSSDGNLNTDPTRLKRDNQPFEIIKRFYKEMNQKLKEITEFYGLWREENNPPNFDLENNEIVHWFLDKNTRFSEDGCCDCGCGIDYHEEDTPSPQTEPTAIKCPMTSVLSGCPIAVSQDISKPDAESTDSGETK